VTGRQSVRALVIGASGFVGSHLTRELAQAGAEVHGTTRRNLADFGHGISVHRADLLDRASVDAVLARVRPSHVFNLAGRVKTDRADPEALQRIHVTGSRILFESLRAAELRPVVFIASSAAVYGIPQALPVTEEAQMRAQSAYGKSKVEQENVALAAMHELAVPVICARAFNLVGPGLSPTLFASQVARDIAKAEAGGDATLRVGNLDQRRDFLDIRDAVRAFVTLAMAPHVGGIFNVCTGQSVPVRACIERLVALARVRVSVMFDSAPSQGSDVDDIFGSTARLASAMPWTDFIPLERSLDDLLDDWRWRLAGKAE
jgi:GDP-4-dehydro-6-deoxy-D-mannose reductase